MQTEVHENAQTKSSALFQEAQHYIPGGVNSPVRAFKAVGGHPLFITAAQGAYLIDADQKKYIDYVGSWGPMILGHAHPAVIDAVTKTAKKGLSFGAPCPLEVELARLICSTVPSIEKVRMVNSGTEATMTAIRLARGITGRDKFIKFEGCYHGHSDSLLVNAGSGALTFGTPSSPGVTANTTQDTLTATYNDLDSVTKLFEKVGANIAAIILEPIAGNMNMILPEPGFLQGLRDLCDQYGSLLIIDEVMTGFRVARAGAQELYTIKPDITTFGKIIGGGMPVGAIGACAAIMGQLSPEGPIYQAGTLSGNPIAMTAGLATLQELQQQPDFYHSLFDSTQTLVEGILARAQAHNIPMTANFKAGMFGLFFTTEESISRFHQLMNCNKEHFNQFFHGMLKEGINLAPSSFEAGFVSGAHGKLEIDKTINAADKVLATLK